MKTQINAHHRDYDPFLGAEKQLFPFQIMSCENLGPATLSFSTSHTLNTSYDNTILWKIQFFPSGALQSCFYKALQEHTGIDFVYKNVEEGTFGAIIWYVNIPVK